jgi:SWI/SNF-related matrix-associated actin-dependent regulator of chromatin subfamily A3
MSEKGSDLGFMVQDAVDVLFPLLRDGLIRVEANKIPDAIPERLANHSSLHQLRIAVTWYGLLSNQKLIQDQIGEGKLNFTGIAAFNHTSSQSSRGPSSSLVYLTGITGGGGGGGGGGHFGGSKLVTSVITDVSSMSTATMIDSYYDDKKTQRLALSDPHRCIKLEGKIFHNYQKQGLGWMTQREEKKFEITDTEGNPREDAMWRCHTSDSGKTVYINKLTKKEQTNAPVRPRGGLLMDDMGLGKTVQMICLIVNTAYEQVKRTLEPGQRPAPTLIVCPVSVIAAWEGQFKEWVHEGKISVYKHHGTHREKDHTKFNRLDVVITSYDIVRGEHQDYLTACRKDASLSKREKARKAKEKEVEKDSSEDSEDSLSSEEDTLEVQSESTFPLFQTEWQRVVLDEAHTIKNDTTKQAQACMALRAQRNWALTGTPLQNSVMDLYPLFRFVKEPLLNKEHFEGVTGGKGKNRRPKNEDYARAIKLVLSNIGLRRLKTSKDENGRPLVVMPEKSIRDVDVHLSDDELKIYREIQRNARDVSDRMKCAPNKKSMVLPIITRMRQVCDDVRLINSKYLCGSGVADDGKQTPSDILANLDGDAKCLNCEKRLEDQTTGAANCGHVLCGECLDEIKESDKRICPVCEAPMTRENGLVYDYETNASEQKALAEELPEHVKRCRAGLSSKLQAVLNLLHETRNQKTVIFSQWTTMLDLTRDALDSSGTCTMCTIAFCIEKCVYLFHIFHT